MAAELDAEARDRALEALAAGCSKAEAARRSGYSRRHLTRLQSDPVFAQELEKRSAAIAAESGLELADAREARAFLRSVVAGEAAGEAPMLAVRVAAAKAILAAAPKTSARRPELPPQSAPSASAIPAFKLLSPEEGRRKAEEWLEAQTRDDERAAQEWRERTEKDKAAPPATGAAS